MLHFNLEKFSPLRIGNISCSSDITVKVYKQNSLVLIGYIEDAYNLYSESIVLHVKICDDYYKRSILSIFID